MLKLLWAIDFIPASVAGLHFWEVVFSRRGQSGCFTLHWDRKADGSGSGNGCKHVRRLLFIVQNQLTKVAI